MNRRKITILLLEIEKRVFNEMQKRARFGVKIANLYIFVVGKPSFGCQI